MPFVMEKAASAMTAEQLTTSLISVLNYALANPAFLYGFWDKSEGILGAAPELLFRLDENKKLATVACAGTASGNTHPESLLNDPKERREHQLVVQGILESLNPFGRAHLGAITVLKLSRLMHLLTPITIELKAMPSFETIVRALHPTPALGAFPRDRGMMWLKDYQQKIDRRRFGAPAGYLLPHSNQACCYVSIRNLQWSDNGMLLSAGCGIVAESSCDREWGEINLKLHAIKEMLAL